MKLTEYPSASKIDKADILILDGSEGTRKATAEDLTYALAGFGASGHRMIFRGKSLGTTVTVAQKTAIQNGTFDDLYLGDYWTINGVKWRIADFDYWYKCGDTAFEQHHLLIVPDTNLATAKINTSLVTTGGYVGSEMYKTTLPSIKSTIEASFPDLVLSHREYLINAVTSGYPSAGAWTDSTVELMSELMVYGTHLYGPSGDGTTIPKRYTNSPRQLALFMVNPMFIIGDPEGSRVGYWLRDVVSATKFSAVTAYGPANETNVTVETGVRPVFAIGSV